MILLSVIFGLILAAVLAERHQVGARHAEAIRESRELAGALVAQIAAENTAHRAEIQTLLQRIQAPEAAVIQHIQDTAGPGEATYPLDEAEQAQAQDWQIAAEATLQQIREHEADIARQNGTIA